MMRGWGEYGGVHPMSRRPPGGVSELELESPAKNDAGQAEAR